MRTEMHAIVSGIVQGVGFRWFVWRAAERLQVTGYVRNGADGSVELVAQGERAQLELLLDVLRHGPPGARVTAVDLSWQEARGEFEAFEIRH
ncbi:MAG: acylphosphatase [Candidatus Edwardsbacteria bacterium]|nr:acylphosphatase [Candidatus Edwardsbacteria bacterium]